MVRCRADIFVADLARGAASAANPWIDGNLGTGLCSGVGANAVDYTGNLMSECEGKRTTSTNIKFLAVAEQEKTVLHMQVGMADATPLNSNDYLGSLRLRRVDDSLAQRRAIGGQGLAMQLH